MRNRAKHIFSLLLLITGAAVVAMAQEGPSFPPGADQPKSTIKILGNVYGGGDMAKVDGSTDVTINEGQFAGEIFGGGNGALNIDGTVKMSADVSGSTAVTINGGEIIFVDGKEENNHNIYGGGNKASNIGDSTKVRMNAGMVTWYTFLSNQAATIPAWYTWYDQAMNPNTQKTPIIAVFGAGYGAHTDVAHNTNVTINIPGTSDIKPANGTAFTHAELEEIDQIIMRWMPDHRMVGQFVSAVHGGGYDGTVGAYDAGAGAINYDKTSYTSQTSITIEGQPFIYNIFGGGLGSKSGADANGNVNSHVGAVYGGTKVNIKGGIINGDVFGGGAGIAGQKLISNPMGGSPAQINFPYTFAAQVYRETDITISGNSTVIFGNVYGGGDIANTGWYTANARPTMAGHQNQTNQSGAHLDFTTSLHLDGGDILGSVYGGGNGRKRADIEQYKFIGSVIGSTNVSVNGSHIWSDIYGGGNTGCVYACQTIAATKGESGRAMQSGVIDGNTNVSILNGMVARDIFGGGYGDDPEEHEDAISSADVYGNTYVYFSQADLEFTNYWKRRTVATQETMGSWGNPTGEETGHFLPQRSGYDSENDIDYRNTESDITHNLYGGGNIASTIFGNTYVYMSAAPTAPSGFNTTDYYRECIANVAKPHFSVFGGGYGQFAKVQGDANSNINLAEGTGLHSIVGGGMNGPVEGSTNVSVNNNPSSLVHHVYGGGYYAHCGNTQLNITSGTILENVFGGAVMGNINENGVASDIATHITIGRKNQSNPISIGGNVYGANDVSGIVNGIAKLTIYGGTINGDVFGAGNGDHIGYYEPNKLQYDLGKHDNNYYNVLHREPGAANGKTYVGRPQTIGGVELTLDGTAVGNRVTVRGQVFGGGNSCTVGAWDATMLAPEGKYHGNPHETRDDPDYFLGGGKIDVTLGSHVTIGRTHAAIMAAGDAIQEKYLSDDENVSGLFMGCSGRHLATQETSETDNFYHHYYDANTKKYWPGFAVYQEDGTTPLSRAEGLQSFNAYMNNILVWTDDIRLTIADDAEDIWLANFVGGGFRGSMKLKTNEGKFDYKLPEGVTVSHAVVGGAYNTDVVYRIFETSDGHTYTETAGHYNYLTDAGGLTKYDPSTNPTGDYHHIEYAEDGETIMGIVRFYYDGGMLAENGGNRAHDIHADPRANADEYATAYFEPIPAGSSDPAKENQATRDKLFTANKGKAFLHLDLRCAMEPEVTEANPSAGTPKSVNGGNVYGGCYMSGLVQGDSWVDYGAWLSPTCTDPYYFDKSNNMHIYDEAANFERNKAMTVYGAGYGKGTHTEGDTYLYIKSIATSAGGDGDQTGKFPYLFNAFGGSNMGTVNGNTNVYFAVGKQGTLLGSLYGGGYKGDISGNTFVELAEGFATNVYGGSRQANIGGASHVWAYDGKSRGINDANHLIICNLYGGNDIAGTISGTMPAAFTATKWTDLEDKEFNTYVEISADDNSANRGFPLVGSAYAGGNGEKWAEDKGTKPNVGNALMEIGGGSTLRAFGGGNMATVTGNTYIFSDAISTQFANVTFSAYQKNIMQKVFFSGVPTGYTWNDKTLVMDPYHVVKLYGGNNVAEMAIQPTWNLLQGKLGSVYSGGNLGDMTYYNPSGNSATAGQLNPTPKGLRIDVSSDLVEINELYGGCRMADVIAKDGEGNLVTFAGADEYGATVNVSGGRINNVYGGNDIAGHVYNGTNVNITGAISGDVYGSGNGNYVYQYDATKDAPAAGVMEERVEGTPGNVDYIYYAFRGNNPSATAMQKLQAINAIRPNVDKAYLNIAGTESNLVYVKGNVYCGGNASTVSGAESYTKFDIGSYCVLNGVYMGSNGQEMTESISLDRIQAKNNLYFNSAALLTEYMNAVAMAALPREFTLRTDLVNAYIGTFCLGGNRGSMTTIDPVHMTIPASVTIFNKVVGGCNDAYLSYSGYSATGGFITWNTDKTQPKITLDIHAKFEPWKMHVPERNDDGFDAAKANKFLVSPVVANMLDDKYCNVYGGCYTHGYVYGDVEINMYSDMIGNFETQHPGVLANNIEYNESHGRPVFSVFGGGYGQNTVVYGNTHIRLLNENNTLADAPAPAPARAAMTDPEPLHPTVNAIYGGGEQGKMIGTATIHIADGTVYSNVVGGALAGNIYGNTEILVGYPSYYEVQKTGEYKLKRSNFTAAELAKVDGAGDKAVRQSIFLTKGDRINAAVYQAINDYGDAKQTAALQLTHNKVSKTWDDIEIDIKGGIYGGGYSRENVEDGQTAMANTVLKFTSTYNLATAHPEYWTSDATLSGSAIAQANQYVYGGNSNIWVQDEVNAQNWNDYANDAARKEHITISTETDPTNHLGKGGIFGDGHSSLVAAFRSAAIDGYGYAQHQANDPKLLNTFQRLDILQIRDCSMKMYGEIDVATGQNDPTNYAVSRITELMLNSNIDDTGNLSPTNQLNARNVIDFYNPVHYLGSITSEVTFKPVANGGSKYHDIDGVVESQSYYDYKSALVAGNYDYQEHGIHAGDVCRENFAKRNAGTAKNLIRIDDPQGRGVHLKVVQENNYSINSQGVREEQSFYGPLSGVFQFELTHVSARGGGYVYSNNIHGQTITQSDATYPGTKPSDESFLQTSGNVFFVPITLEGREGKRQVYDDCYPVPFSNHKDGQLDEAHYWFVEGDGPTWCSYPETPTKVNATTITIETAEELAWVYDYIDKGYDSNKATTAPTEYNSDYDIYPAGFAGWTIQLGNDIDLEQLTILDQREVRMIWCPIADQKNTYFKGTFDGKGYKIDGMLLDVDFITTKNTYGHEHYATQYDHYFGLFAKTQGATIKNVELSAALVRNVGGNDDEQVHIGTLITEVDGTTVMDCSVQQTDTITSNMTREVEAAAAFICHTAGAPSTINRNFVSGSIYSENVTAPISGFISTLGHNSTMEHCYSLVDVRAQQVAGLAYMVDAATLEHSYYAGTLTRTDANTNWGAILANAGAQATVKHCYYDGDKNSKAKGYQGSDATVFSSKDTNYTSWSTFGLSTADMTGAEDLKVWRSCYSHGHSAEEEAEEYRCELDATDGLTEAKESAWNKGVWTYIPGFYPFLKSQEIDCSALTTAFQMPTAEALGLTSLNVAEDERWYNVNQDFQLPTYGNMYWTVANNTLLLDPESKKAQGKVDAHLYLGGPDALTLNCDEYVRWMRDIYVIREDINKQEDLDWYGSLSDDAKDAIKDQLRVPSFTQGMLRNKEVTNISKKNASGKYLENGFDGDLHIWNREGSAGTVTNPYQYKVNGVITYYTGYDNPYLWHEVNLPYVADHVSVYRSKTQSEYNISARNSSLAEDADGGNFWLRSFDSSAEIPYGGHTFQQAWHDPATGENYGHRPSVLRFPKVMKVDGNSYLAGDYWCYEQTNTIDGENYTNGGSEIRFHSTTGNTVYGTKDYVEDHRGVVGFIVYGNPTLSNIQLEGYYWLLETEKRDTLGVNDPLVRPEINTDIAQWFSLRQDPIIPPLGIWIDGPEDFKEQAYGGGNSAPLRISGMHEPGASEMYGEKEASFTASGSNGLLGVFSYIDQIINIYDVNGHLTFTTPVRANTGFTINLPSHLFLVQGTNSPKQVKVML